MECLQNFLFLLLYFHSFSLPSIFLSTFYDFIFKSAEWPCCPSAWRKPKLHNQIKSNSPAMAISSFHLVRSAHTLIFSLFSPFSPSFNGRSEYFEKKYQFVLVKQRWDWLNKKCKFQPLSRRLGAQTSQSFYQLTRTYNVRMHVHARATPHTHQNIISSNAFFQAFSDWENDGGFRISHVFTNTCIQKPRAHFTTRVRAFSRAVTACILHNKTCTRALKMPRTKTNASFTWCMPNFHRHSARAHRNTGMSRAYAQNTPGKRSRAYMAWRRNTSASRVVQRSDQPTMVQNNQESRCKYSSFRAKTTKTEDHIFTS